MNKNCSTCCWRDKSKIHPEFCWEPKHGNVDVCLNWRPDNAFIADIAKREEWVRRHGYY